MIQTCYLNRIYERLDHYTNYFLPVMHQIAKQWAGGGHGGYLRRKHDEARPPLGRLIELQPADWAPDQASKLRAARAALNVLQERRTFHILSYPELFPAAQVALRADDADDVIASLSADDYFFS